MAISSNNYTSLYGNTQIAATSSGSIIIAGNLAVNGGNITSTASTFNLINTGVSTANFAGAATTINIGNGLTTTTIGGDIINTGDAELGGVLYVDHINQRVGVNVANPSVDLQVAGTLFADYMVGLQSLATNANLIYTRNADTTITAGEQTGIAVKLGGGNTAAMVYDATTANWQPLINGTNSGIQVGQVNIDGVIRLNTATSVVVSPTVNSLVFATTSQSSKLLVQVTQGTEVQICYITMAHNSTTAFMNQFGDIESAGTLATFTVNYTGSATQLLATTTLSNTSIKVSAELFNP